MNNNYAIEQITHQLTWKLRQSELYPDLSLEDIKLNEDMNGIHFGLFTDNRLIGVVSLFEEADAYQFRKFAIAKAYQYKGYGSLLLSYIIDFAENEKKTFIWCNARESALVFYEKFGFLKTEKSFTKAGINFIVMEKKLNNLL